MIQESIPVTKFFSGSINIICYSTLVKRPTEQLKKVLRMLKIEEYREECLSEDLLEGAFHRRHSMAEDYKGLIPQDLVEDIKTSIDDLRRKLFVRNLPDCTANFDFNKFLS